MSFRLGTWQVLFKSKLLVGSTYGMNEICQEPFWPTHAVVWEQSHKDVRSQRYVQWSPRLNIDNCTLFCAKGLALLLPKKQKNRSKEININKLEILKSLVKEVSVNNVSRFWKLISRWARNFQEWQTTS